MKTKPNQIFLPLTLMMKYVQMCQEQGNALDWSKILDLEDRPCVSIIEVKADNNEAEVLAHARWGWNSDEIKFGTIHVEKPFRQQGIADTIMKIFIAIARFYDASKITGVIDGEDFLPGWYQKLGFTVYDDNKLLMDLSKPL